MASKPSVIWVTNSIVKNLAEFTPKMRAAGATVMDRQADISTSNMKQNAPWKDRTGNARATLATDSEHEPEADVLVLHGGMSYQIYLETRWGGRLAAIKPETTRAGRRVMLNMTQLFKLMRAEG
jgi:hypothetical protein